MTKYGFVLLPDKQTEQKLININALFNGPIKLDKEQTLPHVTIVQTFFKPGFEPELFLEQFKNITPLASEPKVSAKEFNTVNEYSFLEFKEASWLKNLNRIIIETVEDWIDVEQAEPVTYSNDAERISWERTGYQRNLDAYHPHFTLGYTPAGETIPQLPLLEDTGINRIAFRRLVFCEHGEYGIVSKVLSSIHLPFTWN